MSCSKQILQSRALLWAALAAALGIGCQEAPAPVTTGQAAGPATHARPLGPARVLLSAVPLVPTAAAEVVLEAGWGAGPGQLGRRLEASNPGPMALHVDRGNELLILDQVNRRVLRHSAAGARLGQVGGVPETAEYFATTNKQIWVLAAPPAGTTGHLLLGLGQPGTRTLLDRALILPTGLFADHRGLWVETRHRWQTLMHPTTRATRRARELGRPDPSQPGTRLLASIQGPWLARVSRVHAGRYSSPLLELQSALPLVGLHELLVGADGTINLALLTGRQAGAPDHRWTRTRRLLLVYHPQRGAQRVIQLAQGQVTDCNRDLALGPDNAVYQLVTHQHGARVLRWSSP